MKKIFTKRLIIYMLIALIVVIAGLFTLRTVSTRINNTVTAESKLSDVKDKLSGNAENIQRLTDNLSSNSLAKSRAFADLLAADPSIVGDMDRLEEIRKRLDVSELHIIDKDGIIISSTVEAYIGFDMGSGEQSAAFLVIVDDPSIEIAQEPQMNAAEGILMQYIGVARSDDAGLVQVGIHPTVLENTLENTAVDIVLSEIDYGVNGYVYAIDRESNTILAHRNAELVGKTAAEAGFPDELVGKGKAKIDGVRGYYVSEEYDGKIIGTFMPSSEYYSERNNAMIMIVIAMIVIFSVLLITINHMVDAKIISGIKHIGNAVKEIAEGDLSFTLNEQSNPEFAQLSEDINKMTSNINESLENNERLLSKQRQNMVDIKEVCESLGRVADETQTNADMIFEGTGEQEQAVENLRHVLERLTAELNSNVDATFGVTKEMADAVREIMLTGEQINILRKSMKEIAEMSKSIETIIDEINSIADQTNILSLNATIEAARAGEAGKGFAVVASEVGSLAQKSAEAAKKTNDLITSTIASVKSGQDVTEHTASIFGETVQNIEKANNDVRSIAEMVKCNMNIVAEASDGMNKISDVVEKNIRISQDTKQVSSNMVSVSNRLLELVE